MAKAFVGNAADGEQVKEAGNKEKRAREQELSDLRAIMSHPTGRRTINRLLNFCGVFKLSYTGNSETFFKEGQRNVGLMLLTDVNECASDFYNDMINESKKELLNNG